MSPLKSLITGLLNGGARRQQQLASHGARDSTHWLSWAHGCYGNNAASAFSTEEEVELWSHAGAKDQAALAIGKITKTILSFLMP